MGLAVRTSRTTSQLSGRTGPRHRLETSRKVLPSRPGGSRAGRVGRVYRGPGPTVLTLLKSSFPSHPQDRRVERHTATASDAGASGEGGEDETRPRPGPSRRGRRARAAPCWHPETALPFRAHALCVGVTVAGPPPRTSPCRQGRRAGSAGRQARPDSAASGSLGWGHPTFALVAERPHPPRPSRGPDTGLCADYPSPQASAPVRRRAGVPRTSPAPRAQARREGSGGTERGGVVGG